MDGLLLRSSSHCFLGIFIFRPMHMSTLLKYNIWSCNKSVHTSISLGSWRHLRRLVALIQLQVGSVVSDRRSLNLKSRHWFPKTQYRHTEIQARTQRGCLIRIFFPDRYTDIIRWLNKGCELFWPMKHLYLNDSDWFLKYKSAHTCASISTSVFCFFT